MKFSQEKLEQVAENSLYTNMANSMTIEYSFEIFKRHIKAGSILELGPAEGLMTKHLLALSNNVVAVDGSQVFCDQLKQKFGDKLKVVYSLFEEYKPEEKFDNIILGHVLEHVENPQEILALIKNWVKPDGIILCAVPNARSIHRQAAVKMGLIQSIFDQSEKDKHHGHLRIYTPETFETEFVEQHFEIIVKGGYWLKPIADKQIEASWTTDMLKAFMKLGETYPDIAGEIYIVATAKK
jgi:2-polyprenyl-3-methyl-5-hydroxy-6-metoxy-1,4-benzoquinol methylase